MNKYSETKGCEYIENSLIFVVTIFIAIAIISLSLAVFSIVDGYAVTVASFIILAYCLYIANHQLVSHIIVYGLILVFMLINAIINIAWLNWVEFVKSFLLTAVTLYVYITSFDPKCRIRKYLDYSRFLRVATYIIVGFQLIQVGEEFLFGSTQSWFWLNGLSISTAENIGRFEAPNALGFYRPVSVFHEPSYLAAVSFIMLIINDHLVLAGRLRYLLIGSIALSLSTTILVILFVYLLAHYFFCGKYNLILGLLLIVATLFFGSEYLWKIIRLNEVTIEGTSGYIRFIEPMMYTISILGKYIYGIPLGQSSLVFNNSLFLIPLYFGVFAPFVVLFWLFVILVKIKQIKSAVMYVLGLLSLLLVNGAIFTLESAFLLLLLNYAFIQSREL